MQGGSAAEDTTQHRITHNTLPKARTPYDRLGTLPLSWGQCRTLSRQHAIRQHAHRIYYCAPRPTACVQQLRISESCDRGAPGTPGVIELPHTLAAQIQGGASDAKIRVHRELALDANQCRPHRAPQRGTSRNNLAAGLPVTAQAPKSWGKHGWLLVSARTPPRTARPAARRRAAARASARVCHHRACPTRHFGREGRVHRGDELRALDRKRRAAQQGVCGVLDIRERAVPAVPQRVRHLRARVATPHHLRGDLRQRSMARRLFASPSRMYSASSRCLLQRCRY